MTIDDYLSGIRAGDRRVLARAITLVESKLPAHQELARQLIDALLAERAAEISTWKNEPAIARGPTGLHAAEEPRPSGVEGRRATDERGNQGRGPAETPVESSTWKNEPDNAETFEPDRGTVGNQGQQADTPAESSMWKNDPDSAETVAPKRGTLGNQGRGPADTPAESSTWKNAPGGAPEAHGDLTTTRQNSRANFASRIGVTGPPGAGKSCLIETLGLHALEHGANSVAVLAIDPTSQLSGGSILGDKTRMERLSLDPRAFVRPSPSKGTLGGVARRTRECIWLLEAAGFDLVLVETVGVGQSETAVSQLVDTVLLVALPGAGDELQGIKRGVMETADLIFLNKSEGERAALARQSKAQFLAALRLLKARGGWKCPVLHGSALNNEGLEELWTELQGHRQFLEDNHLLLPRRGQQGLYWLERLVEEQLKERFYRQPEVAARYPELRAEVASGRLSPDSAARTLLGW